MKPHQYHVLLTAFDRVLATFDQFAIDMSEDDSRVRHEIEVIRSQILRAESGHPFPFKHRLLDEEEADFDMTRAPWFHS